METQRRTNATRMYNAGKMVAAPHTLRADKDERKIPIVAMDYAFLDRTDDIPDTRTEITVLNIKYSKTGNMFPIPVCASLNFWYAPLPLRLPPAGWEDEWEYERGETGGEDERGDKGVGASSVGGQLSPPRASQPRRYNSADAHE